MVRLMVRCAAVAGYAELLRQHGLDPAPLARRAGLAPRTLARPDTLIPARKAYQLLELCAAASALPDFGLQLAARRGLSHLGALGLLARDEPDVRSALLRMTTDMNLHSNCVAMRLREDRGIAVAELTVLADGQPDIRQSVETGLGVLFRILQRLLGPSWRPIGVQFIHAAGGSDPTCRQFFRCPVSFSTDCNAVVLRSSELDQPMPGADQGLRAIWAARAADPLHARRSTRVSARAVDLQAPSPLSVGDSPTLARVREAILQLLPQGQCGSQAVADRFGIDRRTLHRHLARDGLDFSAVLAALRLELARQYLDARELGMADIAGLLGFHAPSSFTRWFTRSTGLSPSRWREMPVAARGKGRGLRSRTGDR